MAHTHKMSDGDTRFIIDPIKRTIQNKSGKKVLVQNDHNSEIFTFEMSRMIENHDMSMCDRVEILYMSEKQEDLHVYIVKDLRVDSTNEDRIIFSWKIKDDATQLVGKLNFGVRFYCTKDFIWNTAVLSEIKILAGMPKTDDMEILPEEEFGIFNWYEEVIETWK